MIPPMYFQQFYEPRLAQYSYLIGCQATGDALVVDPLRHIEPYVQQAQQQGLSIAYVTETHIHADFLSGARALAQATGATLLLSDEGGPEWAYTFPHQGLRKGDSWHVGNLRVQAMHTPGHTPEHLSFLITDTGADSQPVMLLSGDFLFVGEVGRPDLLDMVKATPGQSEAMARQLFHALQKIRALPDHLLVWPGHGAGSACGKALGAMPATTLGYEKRTNWALLEQDEEAFVLRLLAEQPLAPRYFPRMKRWNRQGKGWDTVPPRPRRLSLHALDAWRDQGAVLVDVRDKLAFAQGHIPGSLYVPDSRAFLTWAGWMLEPDRPIILIAFPDHVSELTLALYQIGLDQVVGYFPDVHRWVQAGRELAQIPTRPPQTLAAALKSKTAVPVDVRELHELREGFIPGAIWTPAGRLLPQAQRPDIPRELVFYCSRGDRAMVVASALKAQGFQHIATLLEGMEEWRAAGLPLELPDENPPYEEVSVEEAFQRMQQGWLLLDVRDAESFARGHPSGARHLPTPDLMDVEFLEQLRARQPLLLICNTGNRSAMVADLLIAEEIDQVANVAGGVVAWQLHHLPWEKESS